MWSRLLEEEKHPDLATSVHQSEAMKQRQWQDFVHKRTKKKERILEQLIERYSLSSSRQKS
jgi:hypothetical protein